PGGPSAPEPGHRAPHRRHPLARGGQPDRDPDVQRLRGPRRLDVLGHGPGQVVLSEPRRGTDRKTPARLLAAKAMVHGLVLLPLGLLLWQTWQVASGLDIDALGADPAAEIEHRTGSWALRPPLVAPAVPPLRQVHCQA